MLAAELARYLDATWLRADATAADIQRLCAEAKDLGVYLVCVAPCRVALARHLLEGADTKVGTVVGFPLGNEDADSKRFQAEAAIDSGAQEIDMVLNLGWLKDGEGRRIVREVRDVVEAADELPVKVILETGLLTRDEIIRACRWVVEAEAHFVKTSTGFGPRGASIDDVRLMRQTVGPEFGVKAAGGIRDVRTALAMIEAGANRLGTSAAREVLAGGKATSPS